MKRQREPELMDLNSEAEAYAKADFSQVNQAFVERLMALMDSPPRGQCLDVGTGPADIPIRLIQTARERFGKAADGLTVVAIDASAAMLELARVAVERAGLGMVVRLVQADAKETGLPGRLFGTIFSNSILHHVADAGAMWRELKRLARPGAVFFVRDLARPATTEAAAEIVRKYAGGESAVLQEEYYRSLLAAYTVDEVRAQLDAEGLRDLKVQMVTDRHLDVTGRLG